MKPLNHNTINDRDRIINDNFNSRWIRIHGLTSVETRSVSELAVPECDKHDANPFQVVWLRNIDRLMHMLYAYADIPSLTFVDVGCGSGISTLYAANKYSFKRVIGFDFDETLIEQANKNAGKFQMEGKSVRFEHANARNYVVPNDKCVLFLFNPFGLDTLSILIENNISTLRRTESLVAYANDIHITYLAGFGDKISRNHKYNLSLIQL